MSSVRIALACLAVATTASPALAQISPPAFADANRDGKVSRPEYQISRRTFLMKADRDKNNQVSRAEWDRYTKTVRADFELNGVDGADRIGQGGWWAAIDADRNGIMTPAEIDAMTAPRFARFDTNHDGFIQRAEAERVRREARKN